MSARTSSSSNLQHLRTSTRWPPQGRLRTTLRTTRRALVFAWLAGCAQMLGVDDYAKEPSAALQEDSGASDAGPEAGTPAGPATAAADMFEAKPAAYTAPGCVSCVDAMCAAQRAACDADELCAGYLQKMRAVPPSAYPSRDLIISAMEAQWDSDHGGGAGIELLSRFKECARQDCAAACELGRDFSCVGKFEWPRSYPKRSDVRFRAIDFDGSGGVDRLRFRACPLNGGCAVPMADETSANGGFVTLPVNFSLKPTLADFPEFDGYWLVDGRSDYPGFKLQSTRPYLDRDYAVIPLFNTVTANLTKLSGSIAIGESGTLIVAPYDCRDDPAKGVTLDVWRPSQNAAGGASPCSGCGRVVYSDDDNYPDTTRTEYSSLGVNALLRVPSDDIGDIIIVVRDTSTRKPIAVLPRIGVRVDEFLVVSIYPASTKQLRLVPDAAQ